VSENRVHDDFIWIELAGFLPDGKMIRDQFVRIDDVEAISSWRDKFSNTDVFTSICRYEKPNWQSDFIVPLFFDIDSPGNLNAARENTLILCELIMTRLELDSDVIQIYFSGYKGFHVVVPCDVFNPTPSEFTFELYKRMASNAQKQGVLFADTSVYTGRRLWRFANSINSKSGLYKIPIFHKELLHLSVENLMELAQQPRNEENLCTAAPNQHAIDWYKYAISCMAKIKDNQHFKTAASATNFKHGWRTPPCIKNMQQNTLPDGIRHNAYLSLARFYSWINMHPQEVEEKLLLLDQKNPISDTGSIQRIINWALAHPGFAGCENEVLKRFCDKENCFYNKLISERITTTNMKVT
jgi:hypothetical protein